MRTTLNFPDQLVAQAKIRAVYEHLTLTDLIVQGLEIRLARGSGPRELPCSVSEGGLSLGVSWDSLLCSNESDEAYR